MILKTKSGKMIETKIMFYKAGKYQKEVCEKDETLLTLLPQKMFSNDSIDFLVKTLEYFQIGDKKLNEKEIGKLLDEYLEDNKDNKDVDFYSLYNELIKEFDVSGVMKKGMGFEMAARVQKQMDEAIQQIGEVETVE